MKNKLFIIIGIIVVVGLLIIATVLPTKDKKETKEKKKVDLLGINYEVEGNVSNLNFGESNPVVAMNIENYGSIVIELYPSVAPNTVNNFISLVKSGFYDNNTFHRLIPGFVLQGGDPTGTGTGGPGYSIKGEFTNNGFQNDLKHDQWVVSMARANDPNSAGSQFFICLDKASSLDDSYAAFGKVIAGYDNLNQIVKNEVVSDPESGKLQTNLVLKKSLVDLKGKEYPEVEKISE